MIFNKKLRILYLKRMNFIFEKMYNTFEEMYFIFAEIEL